MKLMVRIGAVVGLALSMLFSGCGEKHGTDTRSVYERQTEDKAGADREGDFSRQGEPNPPKKKN